MINYDLANWGGFPAIRNEDVVKWPAPSGDHFKDLCRVLESGRFHRVDHPLIMELENALRNWTGGLNIRVVSTGTAAIHICLHYYHINNKKVLVSALNWPGAIGPIIFSGMQPEFIDISLKDACLSDGEVIKKISSNSNEIRAVLATHLFGNVNKLEKTRYKLKKSNYIKIVDDCAQNIGFIQLLNTDTTLHSDSVTLSGNGSKHLGAGELGCVCTSDLSLIKYVDKISLSSSSRGGGRVFSPNSYGYNYRPNVFSGAIALGRVPQLNNQLLIRRENSLFLWDKIKGLQGLLPLFDVTEQFNSFCSLPLRIEPVDLGLPEEPYVRDNIVRLLYKEGMPISVWLKKPVWEYMPNIRKEWSLINFPNTKKILDTMFYVTEIAPPNDLKTMQLYVNAFEKVWKSIPSIKNWLIRKHNG